MHKKRKKAERFATSESTGYVIKIGEHRYSRSAPDTTDWYPSRYLWVAFAELLIAAERGDGDTSCIEKWLAKAAAAADSREYQRGVINTTRYGVWDRVRGFYRDDLERAEREFKYLFGFPDEVIREHRAMLLTTGAEGWKAWLKENPSVSPILCGCDLRGADLRFHDLRGADLRNADLRGANLNGADLGGAYLRNADFRGADLGGTELRNADTQGVRW